MLSKSLRFLPATCLLVLSASLVTAQQSDVIRTQTNLVLVPVEVRHKGQHVAGLDRDKFTILQDGKPVKLASFEEVRTTTEHLKRAAAGPKEFTNEVQGNPATARYTIIAIDRINTTTMDMQRLRQGLTKFLSQAADSGEPIRLVAINPSSIQTIQDFTTDPQVLARALERMKTPAGKVNDNGSMLKEALEDASASVLDSPTTAEGQVAAFLSQLDNAKAMEQTSIAFQQRTQRLNSLEALQMVAQTLAGLPGRKSLVWASSGYPFGLNIRESRNSNAGMATMQIDYSQAMEAGALDEYTMRLMNAANIAIYPVDARGTQNTAWDVMDTTHKYSPSYAEKQQAQYANQEVISTFEHLAAATGGKPCFERTDLSGCFKDAMEDARDYYIVGYYVDSKTKPGWHKLQVKVAADANVRSRSGFVYSNLKPADTRVQDMRLALSSYLLDPGIPFRGVWNVNDDKSDKKKVSFDLQISPQARLVSAEESHLDLDVAALARAKDGSLAGQFTQKIDRSLPPAAVQTIDTAGIHYKNAMDLAPGKYVVRLVIRDNNTGRIGSATTLVEVP